MISFLLVNFSQLTNSSNNECLIYTQKCLIRFEFLRVASEYNICLHMNKANADIW